MGAGQGEGVMNMQTAGCGFVRSKAGMEFIISCSTYKWIGVV